MRARIKNHPFELDMWAVEVKYWWSGWIHKKYFSGNQAQDKAFEGAMQLLKPNIVEVKK